MAGEMIKMKKGNGRQSRRQKEEEGRIENSMEWKT